MADTDSTKDKLAASDVFDAAITDEQVMSMEEASSDSVRGQQHRLCLIACSRSSDVLHKLMEENPDAFMDMLDMFEAFNGHAKALAEIADSALARMLLVGQSAEN